MKQYFKNNNSNELILFFLGWGMDERPLLPFKSTKDILFLYDYANLNFDFDFSKYKKIFLIGYSAGVSIATIVNLPKIEFAVAYNGTYDLCNKEYGLTNEIIKVFKGITLQNYMDFRRDYLVTNKKELDFFNENAPYRTLESSLEELSALEQYEYKNKNFNYDKIYISKDDKVFNIKKQKDFWGDKATILNGGHFSFLNFNSLDEIISQN